MQANAFVEDCDEETTPHVTSSSVLISSSESNTSTASATNSVHKHEAPSSTPSKKKEESPSMSDETTTTEAAATSAPVATEESVSNESIIGESDYSHLSLEEVNEKLREARQLNDDEKHNDAMPIVFHSLATLVDKYDEMDIVCAPAYVEYGIALYGQAILDATAFGPESAQNGESDDDDDGSDEGSDDEQEETPVTNHTEDGSAATSSPTPSDDHLLTEEEKKMPVAIQQNIKRAVNIEDLVLAIENLDVARSIYEKHLEKLKQDGILVTSEEYIGYERKLAEVFEWLSRAEMEKEDWKSSLNDISRCLEICNRIEKPYSRELAAVHNTFAKYYYSNQNPAETMKHYTLAANVFALRSQWRMQQFAEEMLQSSIALKTKLQGSSTATHALATSYLGFSMETGNCANEVSQQYIEKFDKLSKNLQEYNTVRKALADKIQDCRDEIRSGVDDDKIRRMIKQMMPTTQKGFNQPLSTPTTTDNTASAPVNEVVNVLAVKRKRPVQTSSTEEEDAKKFKGATDTTDTTDAPQ